MVDVVVEAVGELVGPVPGTRPPGVVVVVIWPRRYLPSSVPPHPAARRNPAATSAVARMNFRSSNRLTPGNPNGAETAQLTDHD